MVKKLAYELSDILDWVENPGLGEHAREEANAGLVIFCRGLVCGLRSAEQIKDDTQTMLDEPMAASYIPDWERAELKRRVEERRRSRYENAQLHPTDECDRPMMGKTPLEERLKD